MFPRIEVEGGIDSLGMNRAGLIDDLEAQNVFNMPAFGEPVSSLTDPNFGRIIAAGGQRRLQLGLRFQF